MIRVLFGSPGCGKTTTACKLLKKSRKYYKYCFANFTVSKKIATTVDLKDLGDWTFPQNSYVVIDEAGIEYNNRSYKLLPRTTISWFKLHRHYKCDVDVFSQSWEDMDITIRRLADQLWYMKKIGPFTVMRRVYKTLDIDENTHQIIDAYRLTKGIWLLLQPLRLIGLSVLFPQLKTWRLCFRPFYYRYFDSWETPDTPVRTFDFDESQKDDLKKIKLWVRLRCGVRFVWIRLKAILRRICLLNGRKRPK